MAATVVHCKSGAGRGVSTTGATWAPSESGDFGCVAEGEPVRVVVWTGASGSIGLRPKSELDAFHRAKKFDTGPVGGIESVV